MPNNSSNKENLFTRIKKRLVNTHKTFFSLFTEKTIDDDLFKKLEEQLIISDIGVETTYSIINNLTKHATKRQLKNAYELYDILKLEMQTILEKSSVPLQICHHIPFIVLMIGVNGSGKTTTIGKLAYEYKKQGKSVILAAGDTFRAAAIEQLQVLGKYNDIPVIAHHTGADPASVIFNAIQIAKMRSINILIADTAGRLHNKCHLMEELKKIIRVIKKLDPSAPHEIIQTIDANTGHNAIVQADVFHKKIGVNSIIITKLDGTAKGGVIFTVSDRLKIPVRYIGTGEKISDLQEFKIKDFIEAIFPTELI
ncbi:fused signal recognition particle receptor [Candidatus Ishikawaella capsulata Mpkobe]|uniref:Signal recognition particle receptor FtsY n=1 Tax=Candidatus Ishikawaella capsulata Mpkobe TaxID=476281 RepID=C5WCE5_9ENTR|nr:fused signal recognition particle receptor [Candidatus Ishikawaella capsulata Mpkobe]